MRLILKRENIIRYAAMTIMLICAIFFVSYRVRAETATVPVRVDGGGVVIVEADDGSPTPDNTRIRLLDGESGSFTVESKLPGSFRYKIHQETVKGSGIEYDKSVYIADIFFEAKEDGTIAPLVMLLKEGSDTKTDSLVFTNHSVDEYGSKTGNDEEENKKKKNKSDGTGDGNKYGEPGTGNEGDNPKDSGVGNNIKTGDNTPISMWIIIILVSLIMIIITSIITFTRKRSK